MGKSPNEIVYRMRLGGDFNLTAFAAADTKVHFDARQESTTNESGNPAFVKLYKR